MGARAFVTDDRAPAANVPLPRPRSQADGVLLVAVAGLLILGLMMLYSASYDYSVRVLEKTPTYLFNRQLIWLGIGLICALACSLIDYHRWRQWALPAMAVTLALLIGVLVVNEIRLGAARALYRGSIQPSELAKLVTVLYLAVWLHNRREQLQDVQFGLIPLGVILGVVGGLIYLQPDLSAVLTVLILGGLLFFLAGADLRQIVFLLLAALVAGWLVVQFSETGRARVSEFWIGLRDPVQSSYHVARSLEAIVNGGWLGVGLGQGTTKLLGLPVPPTDSIFAVLVEELGVLGALLAIAGYGVLVWRGLVIAARAPDRLGALLAGGLALWIGLEALINMSVMVGLMPFAGNALPFFSAGGSNLVSVLAAIGILTNVARQGSVQAMAEESGEERSYYGATVDLRRRDRRGRVSRARRPAGRPAASE